MRQRFGEVSSETPTYMLLVSKFSSEGKVAKLLFRKVLGETASHCLASLRNDQA